MAIMIREKSRRVSASEHRARSSSVCHARVALHRADGPESGLGNVDAGLDVIRFCNRCGARVRIQVPVGDHLPRHVCSTCGNVQYRNPRMIVGIIPEAPDGRILMCRRGISPRRGFWTFPAGYLENDETCCEGAAREAREEAEALVEPLGLYMVINVLEVQQVHLIYRGRLRASAFGPGPESAEVKLVPEDCIPWGELAFPAIETCLRQYFADRIRGRFPVHTMDVIEPRGASALGAAAAWTQMISPPGIAQA